MSLLTLIFSLYVAQLTFLRINSNLTEGYSLLSRKVSDEGLKSCGSQIVSGRMMQKASAQIKFI